MNALTVPNGVAVALFGIALSAAFCDISWTKKNRIILAVGSAAMLLMQALITYMDSWTAMQEMYPLITHLPLAIILSVLSGKWLWPTISVLAAYLCCQLRRWVALLIIAMVPGINWLQPAVEMVVTLPLLAVLLRYVAPAARSFARYPRSMQLLFGVVPLAGYLFDYVTRIYTDLLARGNQAAVEFMPFVCSVAYIVFVLRVSAEERTRGQLEQTRNNLKLQVGQAVREIEALRTSQQQTRAYRHDLRHHLTAIQAMAGDENPRLAAYLSELIRDIPAAVRDYCENPTVNAVVSHYAARCRQEGIAFTARLIVPAQNKNLDDRALCVVFANLLENGVEACGRMAGDEKFIRLNSSLEYGVLTITMDNSFDGQARQEDGKFLSSKRAGAPGVGLSSIRAVAKAHQGDARFEAKGTTFLSSVYCRL